MKQTTIIIRPNNKAEKEFLILLFKKMNIEIHYIEEPTPNPETRKAMQDVERKKGTRVKDSQELFSILGI